MRRGPTERAEQRAKKTGLHDSFHSFTCIRSKCCSCLRKSINQSTALVMKKGRIKIKQRKGKERMQCNIRVIRNNHEAFCSGGNNFLLSTKNETKRNETNAMRVSCEPIDRQ